MPCKPINSLDRAVFPRGVGCITKHQPRRPGVTGVFRGRDGGIRGVTGAYWEHNGGTQGVTGGTGGVTEA